MDAVWVALIVATAGVASTLLLSHMQSKQRSKEKIEDYARQDAVAERLTRRQDAIAAKAAEAAGLLLATQKANLARTEEVARLAAENAERTVGKLDTIHLLVNRKLTDVTQKALTATMALLPFLEESLVRMRAGGAEPTATDLKRVDDTRQSIVDLKATLLQRAENQAEVDAAEESNGKHRTD